MSDAPAPSVLQASPRLAAALAALPLWRLSFEHRLLDDLALPVLKGDLWRSVFGAALHDTCAEAFAALMGPSAGGDDAARPWALAGPVEGDQWVPAGAVLRGSLLLAGSAAQAHVGACMQALADMARRSDQRPDRGLGTRRVQAALVAMRLWQADGTEVQLSGASVPTAWDVWQAAARRTGLAMAPEGDRNVAAVGHAGQLQLHLATPMRLRVQGRVVWEPPALEALLQVLRRRLVRLLPEQPQGIFDPGECDAWFRCARQAPLVAHRMGALTWERYSARQKRKMPREGLLGTLVYGAPAGALYPLFEIARWLQLGGKTTAGQGVIEPRLRNSAAAVLAPG